MQEEGLLVDNKGKAMKAVQFLDILEIIYLIKQYFEVGES